VSTNTDEELYRGFRVSQTYARYMIARNHEFSKKATKESLLILHVNIISRVSSYCFYECTYNLGLVGQNCNVDNHDIFLVMFSDFQYMKPKTNNFTFIHNGTSTKIKMNAITLYNKPSALHCLSDQHRYSPYHPTILNTTWLRKLTIPRTIRTRKCEGVELNYIVG
jgi:hypothetical protein